MQVAGHRPSMTALYICGSAMATTELSAKEAYTEQVLVVRTLGISYYFKELK